MTDARPRSRLSVRQLFGIWVSALAGVGVLGLVAGLLALSSLGSARRQVVDRVDPALIATETLLTALIDQETGVRGFALTGDEDFLEPYERGRATAPVALRRVRTAADVQALDEAVEAWQEGFARPLVAEVRGGRSDFTVAEVGAGKRRFDAVRAEVDRVQEGLRAERTTGREELRSSASRVRGVVIAFALTTLVGLVAAALVLRRTVVAPVARLAGQVRDGTAVEPGGAREIAELGDDVAAMRARIEAEVTALERSNAELEQFAYVASHDLQEPLRKIASFTQMLQKRYGGQLDERADTYMEFAVDGAKRMQELINDLLAFSRVGRMTEDQTDVDTRKMVVRAVRTLQVTLEESGGRVDAGDLPAVRGEAPLLEMLFTNLIANGLKFRGPEAPVVAVRAQRRGADWCFTVADNGIGIEPEYAERIFVIFQRLHPRTAYDGTGIGLAMCRKIVEHHGGTIWLDPAEGPGATFHFTLPATTEDP